MPRGMKVQVLSGLPIYIFSMSIKELKSKTLYKEFSIEIPYSQLEDLLDNKVNELLPNVTLPGFRTGKAPVNIVKKKYETKLLSEVMEKLIQDNTKKLIEEKKLKLFRQPRVDIKKYEKEKPIELEVKVDLEPEVKLKKFEEINLTKYEISLSEKNINENYDSFINSQKKYGKLKNDRSVKIGDKIFVNLSSEDNSAPNFIKEQKNLPIITDSDYQILPDISKRLLEKNVKVGDKIKIKFDLKDILKLKNKKDVEFLIEILSIEESVPFKIDDKFLKKMGLKNENELKENLKNNLSSQYNEGLKQIEKKELMDILDKNHNFDLPQGVIDEQFHEIWHRLEHAKKENKLDEDDKNLSEEELKKRYQKISERRVKLAVLIQFIAKKEKIEINEKELTNGLLQYASNYPGQEKKIMSYFKENPMAIENIRGPLIEKKVIDLVLSKVKPSKKKLNIDDFNKLQEKVFKIN